MQIKKKPALMVGFFVSEIRVSPVHGKTSQYTKQVMTGLPKAFATAPS
jgi:hypothetical protein